MMHWDMLNKATKFEFSLFNMSQCVICSPVWRFLYHVIAKLQRNNSNNNNNNVVLSNPLPDYHKVVASNQYALPVLMYPMWTQSWPIVELQQLDRESRKILKENGGYHPMGTTDLLYLPRKFGGRGLKSVESTYKNIKVKTAIKLYAN